MTSRTRLALLAIVIVVATVIAVQIFRRNSAADHVLKASGTIEATEVDVSFQIQGRIAEVLVREGQPVKAGDVLARMSPDELQSRLNQIRASLDAVSSQALQQASSVELRKGTVENQIVQAQGQADAARIALERLREGTRPQEIRVAEAAVTQAEAEYERRRSDRQRMSGLLERDSISRQEFEAVLATSIAAEENLRAARERLALAREGARKEDIAEADARARAAQAGVGIAESGRREIDIQRQGLDAAHARERELRAQLEAAQTQLGYTEIRSPIAGVILLKNVESGEVVNPGTPVVTVGDVANLWMNIYIPETKTGLVKLGMPVTVRVDAFPDQEFSGTVSFISTQSEFTPKTIQTQEERVNLVFRTKVILQNIDQKLKPGMPADAEMTPR